MAKSEKLAIEPVQDSQPSRDKTTRETILEAAARLIVEEGFVACTMRSLSDRVNIKAGSLYYHFASKDEIVMEIMNLGVAMLMERVISAVSELPDGTSFDERIRAAIRAHIECKVDQELPFMQVYEHLPPVTKRRSRAVRQKYANFWIEMMEYGIQCGEIRRDLDVPTFVPYFLGGLNRVPEWFHPTFMKTEQVTETICSTVLTGIWTPKRV